MPEKVAELSAMLNVQLKCNGAAPATDKSKRKYGDKLLLVLDVFLIPINIFDWS